MIAEKEVARVSDFIYNNSEAELLKKVPGDLS